MADVHREDNPDRLRQMAVLLENENARLHKELQRLVKEIAELRGQTEEQAQGALETVLDSLQPGATSGAKKSKSERRGRRRRPKGPPKDREDFGPTNQESLELDETVIELPEDERTCDECGLALKEMKGGFEESEYIDIVVRKFVVRRTKRQKYTKTCSCGGPIVTAPNPDPPETLGGRYSIAFCAAVAEDKFCDHLPLRRQERAMGRLGLNISANVLFSCLWALAKRLSTTYQALHGDVLAPDAVHIDETGWRAMNAGDEVRELWGISSDRGAYYRLLPNRSHEGARTMLGDYDGWVLSDGLAVYGKAAREYGYRIAGCWSHARRYFYKIEGDFPETTELLDWIDELFLIEREIDDADVEDRRAHRRTVRTKRSAPLVDKIYAWLTQGKPPPGTALEKAVNYVHGQWPKLKHFLEHPEIPLSNNAAERALRPGVIGRKNYQGTRSKRGEIVVCTMYTVIETARIRGIEPRAYLEAIARHDLAEDEREKHCEGDFIRQPLLPDDFIRRLQADE